ncbi:sensor histidine kinase [Nocardiopsis sp. MG754419]|uniref:sensor histidine kinase n=1 Tax=Nocardiopsis sp. MG754419 TaxID=2259865 RepID=UPI001BAD38FA|nr:ATP-binding protein [Nocardiopsis sp. MG754419]MBR8740393.1 two-component sensor histidine kinase [Nocardiopsis sp. MG754419]
MTPAPRRHHWTTMGGTGGPTRPRYALDSAFAVAYVIVDPSTWWRLTSLDRLGTDPGEWVGVVLLALVPIGVVLRWRYPAGAFVTVLLATLLGILGGWTAAPLAAAAWTLYPLALTWEGAPSRRGPGRTALGVAALGGLGALVIGVLFWAPARVSAGLASLSPLALLAPLVLLAPLALSWLLGRVVRERHLREERDAADALARAQNEERLRVAREVHDIVSHTLGTVVVRAGVVRHVHGDDPRALREALAEIEEAGRAATDELRHVLGILREDGPAPLAPQAGVEGLPVLVETARAAGVDCRMRAQGTERLPATVATSVHRIVQESLTNAVRHAPGTTCTVDVIADEDAVEVKVLDTGPARGPSGAEHPVSPPTPAPAAGTGTGLIGMRERVTLHGGTLSAGPRPGGGHRVHVRIPLAPRPTEGRR